MPRYTPDVARTPGRTCALDLGEARVGVALDDELGIYAHPRGTIPAHPRPGLLRALAELVREEKIDRIIVGLPLDMKGGEGDAARKARVIAQEIANATGVEIELWDERLSTVQARRALHASEVPGRARGKSKRSVRAHIDEASAVTILQAWLDGRRGPIDG